MGRHLGTLLLVGSLCVLPCGCDSQGGEISGGDAPESFPTRGPGIGGEVTPTGPGSPPTSPNCAPSCVGKSCGNDGCGGACGTCNVGYSCNATTGLCCQASCTTPTGQPKTCGGDGCGGICGQCNAGFLCDESLGSCVTDSSGCSCDGKMCGDDGCGHICGTCSASQSCVDEQCIAAGGVGSANCESILVCTWGCAPDLPQCVQGCVALGTFAAQTKYDDAQACFDQFSCANMECMGVNCSTSVATCLYATSGAQGCGSILVCQQACPDEPCMQDCILQAHVPAQAAYTTLNFCVRHYCPALDGTCVNDAVWDYTQCAHWYDKCEGT